MIKTSAISGNFNLLKRWRKLFALVLALSLLGLPAQTFAAGPAASGPDWIIETWPQAECSGWWVDFEGSNSTAESWRVKVDGNVIASGTTHGNETVSGSWPGSIDLSQSHTFRVEIFENGNWLGRNDPDGGFGPCGDGTCVTIQAGRNGSVADSYIREDSANSNYGSSSALYSTGGSGVKRQSLLHFDVSAIPSNATVTEASFTVYMAQGSSETVNAHRITAGWDSGTVTWNNFGGQYDGAVQDSFISSNAPTFKTMDLQGLVQSWVSGFQTNYGLLLDHPASSGQEMYYSSDQSTSGGLLAYRPKLVVCYETPPANPPHLTVAKEATSNTCEEVDITLSVTAAGDPLVQRQPLDLMIVFDRSRSMGDDGGSQPIQDAQDAAKLLVDQLNSSLDKVGLVSYSTTASLDIGLTSDFNAVKSAIDGLSPDGFTNIGDAVWMAQQELSANGRPEAVPIIAVLSDGVANRRHDSSEECDTWPTSPTNCTDDAINQAATAKAAGTVIFTIGLNLDNMGTEHGQAVEDLARDVLQTMASVAENYVEAPDSSDLAGIFDAIAQQVTTIAGSNVTIIEVLPTGFHYVPGSATPTPTTVNGQVLTWDLGIISIGQTRSVTFKATVDTPGNGILVDVYPDTRVEYDDYLGQAQSLPFPETYADIAACAASSIGDFVWRDLDQDGLQDTGEPGIDGVLVELYAGACPASGSPLASQTTSGGGAYLFSSLAAGKYCVQVAGSNFAPGGVLAGFGHTSAATFGPNPQTVNLAAGQSYLLADFGYARAALELVKSVDETVVLSGTQVTYSYLFTNTGDTYLNDIVVTDNRLGQICPPPGLPALAPGESFTCIASVELTQSVCNIGEARATATDQKGTILEGFPDLVVESDEVCVDVVDARLTLTPPEASNEVGDDHLFTAKLEIDYGDGNGFVAAPAGETIAFVIANGPGSLSASSCQTNAAGQCNVTLSSSVTGTTEVIASWNGTISTSLGSTSASASDDAIKHWLDARIRISPLQATNPVGEAHVFTVTVAVDDGSAWTAAPDGTLVTFSFTSNTANAFFLGGVDTCTTTAGQCTVTINANQSGVVVVHAATTFTLQGVTLSRETDGQGENSGDATKTYVGAKIGDYVWEDTNGNGLQDEAAAAGINGVRVELYTAGDVFVDFRITANDGGGNPGYYLFENVMPGSYYVKFIKPAGYEFTQANVDDLGPNPEERDSDADPSNGQTAVFSVGGDTVDLTWDAGLYRPVTLGDQTWIDTNSNAIPDDGELLLNSVILQISGPAGTLPLVTTGGALYAPDGNYLAENLPPGTYTVTVISWPSGYLPTGPTTITQTLLSGETNLSFDFPFINTTGVAVVSFQAQRLNGATTLRWTTASEADNAGFTVWRASSATGPWTQISAPLPSLAAGNGGASYHWSDMTVQAGESYWYQLRADPSGQVIGPVQETLGARLFLPMMTR